MGRVYALGEYAGTAADYKTVAQRRALIGKRVGYDLRGSCLKHYGTVTDAGRHEIEIDGSRKDWRSFEQIVVLEEPTND